MNNVCILEAGQPSEWKHLSSDDNLCYHHRAISCGQLGALQVWGDNPLLPDTHGGFQGRGGVQFTVPEIHPLDERDEIEYVSARFEAVTVMAAMQKPIKEEDSSNENNRRPQRDEKSIELLR